MAALKPNFPGFPAPVSPFVFRPDVGTPGMVVTIEYDNATGRLALTGSAHRDEGCRWARFLVGDGAGGWLHVDVPVGDSAFPTSDLGVSTIVELNNASFTADRG